MKKGGCLYSMKNYLVQKLSYRCPAARYQKFLLTAWGGLLYSATLSFYGPIVCKPNTGGCGTSPPGDNPATGWTRFHERA
jgi:hypothetical protein